MKKFKIKLTPGAYYAISKAYGTEDDNLLKGHLTNVVNDYIASVIGFMNDFPDYETKDYRLKLSIKVEDMDGNPA